MLKLCQDYAEIMPAASSAIAKNKKKRTKMRFKNL